MVEPMIRRTPAALHVGGSDSRPPDFLPDNPLVRVTVPAGGFDWCCAFGLPSVAGAERSASAERAALLLRTARA